MDTEKLTKQLERGENADSMKETKKTPTFNDNENKQHTAVGLGKGHGNTDDEEDDDDSDIPELIDTNPKPSSNDTTTLPDNLMEKNIEESNGMEKAKTKLATGNGGELGATEENPEWLDVIGNGALKKKVLMAGQGAATRPQRGELVTLRSKGSLENGSEVDCHEKISFVLGEGDVVTAWDLCLSLMELGEVAIIKTLPRFAYGENGRSPDVPPNAEITYELELLNVEEAPDLEKMTVDQLCSVADKKRERGNELYSRKDYSGAINSYTMALKLLESAKVSEDKSTRLGVVNLKMKCFNNLAAAQLKIDAYEPALKSCFSVLDLDPENVKALFRKGKVLACLGDYEDAVKAMKEALAKEPANKVIHQELSRLTSRESKQRQSERKLYQRMVGDMANVTKVNSKKSVSKWLFAILSVAVVVFAIAAAVSTQGLEPVFGIP